MSKGKNEKSRYLYLKMALLALSLIVGGFFLFYFWNEIKLFTIKMTSPKQILKAQEFLKSFGKTGWFVFEIVQILKVIIAIIPGEPIELLAGAMFGPLLGTVSCMIGNVIGSAIVFFLIKRFGIKLAEFFANSEKLQKLSFLHNSKKLELLVFFIFFLPGTPKDILTYIAPLTTINPIRYLLIVFFARIPSILTSTVTGANFIEGDFKTAIIIFALAAVISVIGYFIHTLIVKYHEKKEKEI